MHHVAYKRKGRSHSAYIKCEKCKAGGRWFILSETARVVFTIQIFSMHDVTGQLHSAAFTLVVNRLQMHVSASEFHYSFKLTAATSCKVLFNSIWTLFFMC